MSDHTSCERTHVNFHCTVISEVPSVHIKHRRVDADHLLSVFSQWLPKLTMSPQLLFILPILRSTRTQMTIAESFVDALVLIDTVFLRWRSVTLHLWCLGRYKINYKVWKRLGPAQNVVNINFSLIAYNATFVAMMDKKTSPLYNGSITADIDWASSELPIGDRRLSFGVMEKSLTFAGWWTRPRCLLSSNFSIVLWIF